MEANKRIKIPNFEPRPYQLPLLAQLDSGKRRAIAIWARRHGKDVTALNYTIKKMVQDPGVYFYMFSTFSQGRKVIWDSVTNEGKPFLDFFPKEIVKSKNVQEMKITLVNGSVFQVIGSDNYNALMGTNPKGVVLSEYALQNPLAWEYIKPILAVNKGWALFISTPRGKNHFWDLYQMAKDNPEWYVEKITVEDTNLLTEQDLDRERREGTSEELIQQEYYCSFDMGQLGSYYGLYISQMEKEGRICHVPYDKNILVNTAWDLGFTDSMSIVFFQRRGNEILIIDYEEDKGYQLAHYLNILRQKKYSYGSHFIPHDGKAHNNLGTTFQQIAKESGFNFTVLENKFSIHEGIEKVRGILPRVFVDKNKCEFLVKCLLQYHSAWDDKARVFRTYPKHDWSSHCADAVRYMALSLDEGINSSMTPSKLAELKRKAGVLY